MAFVITMVKMQVTDEREFIQIKGAGTLGDESVVFSPFYSTMSLSQFKNMLRR